MSSALEWMSKLWLIRTGEAGAMGLRFQSMWPAWCLLLVAVGVWTWIGWCYRRERGTARVRISLAAVRILLITWIVFLLNRPALTLKLERETRRGVALLIDASASMAEPAELSPDVPAMSRLDRFRSAWSRAGVDRTDATASPREWHAYAFDRTVRPLAGVQMDEAMAGLEAKGQGSDLAGAIESVLRQSGAEAVRHIILASDGRSTGMADWPRIIATAQHRGTVIHAVSIGRADFAPDASIVHALSPAKVFAQDPVSVRVAVHAVRAAGQAACTVEVLDVLDHRVLATAQAGFSEQPSMGEEPRVARTALHLKPLPAGIHRMEVRVRPLTGEERLDNNRYAFDLEVIDQTLRVLYVEGYPRFEYRYLRSLLVREKTLASSCLLLSAEADFVQEGTDPIRRFPGTTQELFNYDAIIIGDVDFAGDWFPAGGGKLLEEFAAERGGGLIFLAGPRAMPARLPAVVRKLLPVEPARGGTSAARETFQPRLTPLGRAHPLFQLANSSTSAATFLSEMPGFYWSCDIHHAKPGAEVLLDREQAGGRGTPLVVAGRYGAGRVLFHGTDDTWRWRREAGERFHEAYWLAALRFVARSTLLGQDRRVLLETDREQYTWGEPARVRLSSLDASLASQWPRSVSVLALDADQRATARITLVRDENSKDSFEAVWRPPTPGRFALQVETALNGSDTPATHAIHVLPSAEETRDTTPDPALLERISRGTGGEAISVDDLSRLPDVLEGRAAAGFDEHEMMLADSRLAFVVFLTLICTEWIGRKRAGLV